MEKITNGHPLTQSPEFVKENIETLKKLFPTIVKEGKIDIEELQALLGNEVETEDEYYRFTWAGKSMARKEANKPSTGTLRPNKADSKNWDTTQNIFIEGDNLEALKLLQKSYNGKIKVVCIDPPYNTGNDFVYKDNYADNLKNYLSITGQLDEEGKKNNTNSESDGRYHSNWLNMMYPRLKLARNLMTEDGVIFISIDDNEVHNLRKICDEIFGEDNCIGCVTWLKKRKGSFLSKKIVSITEYILVYSNSKEIKLFGGKPDENESQPIIKRTNSISELNFKANLIQTKLPDGLYKKGNYGEGTSSVELLEDSEVKEGTFVKPLKLKGTFIWSQKNLDEQIELGCKIIINTLNFQVRVFKFQEEDASKGFPSAIIGKEISATNEDGYEELISIFGVEKILDYPKPISLIKNIIKAGTYFHENTIILDFFSGSGTTAHATMQLNAEDNKNRKFICIQLPEITAEKTEAYKAGYKNIAEITKERIRRAGVKIINEQFVLLQNLENKLLVLQEKIKDATKNKLALSNDTKIETLQENLTTLTEQINNMQLSIDNLDTGFRAFKLDSSNINSWDGSLDNLESNLLNSVNNIKENRTEDDVLYEILLKYGLDLTLPIEEKVIANKTVYNVGMGSLFICLANDITTAVAEGIGAWKKEQDPATCRVLFKDNGFTDVEKTNSIQVLKHYGIDEVNSI